MRAVTHGVAAAYVAMLGWMAACGGGCAAVGAKAEPTRLALPAAPVVLASNGMEVRWQTEALLAPNTRLTAVWVRENFIICHGSDHRVYVIDATTGVRLWGADVAEPHETVWPPAVHQHQVWVPTTTKLRGFEGLEGRSLQVVDLHFAPAGAAVTNGMHCFIPDGKGWLQAVSLQKGVVSWGRWTEDAVTAGPVLDNIHVYFGGRNGAVYASAQNVRRITWLYQTEGAIVADLKRTKTGTVLAASLDYALYAFQGASGRLEWRYNAGESIRRPPYAFGEQVFVLTQEAGLTVLDATSGKILWRLADVSDVLTADQDTAYVVTRGNDVLAVNRADGHVRFGVPLRRGTLLGINETDTGVLYLATPEGVILATARKREPEAPAPEPAPAPLVP